MGAWPEANGWSRNLAGQRRGSGISQMSKQQLLFDVFECPPRVRDETSSTFTENMRLPVHRWFRFSAGFSADWVEYVIASYGGMNRPNVLDPFAGSGTTLLAAENSGANSIGVEAHPFLCRIACAKLERRSSSKDYEELARSVLTSARRRKPNVLTGYPKLIHKCYDEQTLERLDALRHAVEEVQESTPASELVWLTLVGILRKTSRVNTAQWQYVLPNKPKKNPVDPFDAFEALSRQIRQDIAESAALAGPRARLILGDARTCEGVPDNSRNSWSVRHRIRIITITPTPRDWRCHFSNRSGLGRLTAERETPFGPVVLPARSRKGRRPRRGY